MAAPLRMRGRLSGPRWLRVGAIAGLIAVTFVASRSCQQSQIRLTKTEAITKAQRRIDFNPTRVQVRLLRQGLGSHPFWIVSLSIPRKQQDTFAQLAVVRVDANTGKVTSVAVQR